jgi:hypothetical protein
MIPMNGHYVCCRCKRPVADCCDGEMAQPGGEDPAAAKVQAADLEEPDEVLPQSQAPEAVE